VGGELDRCVTSQASWTVQRVVYILKLASPSTDFAKCPRDRCVRSQASWTVQRVVCVLKLASPSTDFAKCPHDVAR
jgi:hypothetical protein